MRLSLRGLTVLTVDRRAQEEWQVLAAVVGYIGWSSLGKL